VINADRITYRRDEDLTGALRDLRVKA